MRSFWGVLFLAVFIAGAAHAKNPANDIEIKEAQVGQFFILGFKGNRAALHRWRLIKADSQGLDLLDVSELGWIISSKDDQTLFSANDTNRFHILPKAEGQADLIFQHNYRNVRGRNVFKRKTIRINIHAKAALAKVVN